MTQAWMEEKHAKAFETWTSLNCSDLKRLFEGFNETQLFLTSAFAKKTYQIWKFRADLPLYGRGM